MKTYKPEGFPTLIPYIFLTGVPEFIGFTEKALAAEILAKTAGDDGNIFYATLKIDDSIIFAQEADDSGSATPVALYYYVSDVDDRHRQAIEYGAVSISEPSDHYHGDRNAAVVDKWNNQWWFASNLETLTDEQVAKQRKSQR